MSRHESNPCAVKAFLARYAQSALNQRIATNPSPWYVRHAKRFLESDTVRLRKRTPEQVAHFFLELCHLEEVAAGRRGSRSVAAVARRVRRFHRPDPTLVRV